MIVCFTPNPALDKTVVVPGFDLGRIFRTAEVSALAGGKGFNVARSLRVLGDDPLVVAPLAGHIGSMIADLAHREGLRCEGIWFDGDTRTCLSIVDPASGNVSEIYEAGPLLPAAAWDEIRSTLQQRLAPGDLLTVSGGFPPGVADDALCQLIAVAYAAGATVMLDTYGPQLQRALGARPALVKFNVHEAGDLLGRRIDGWQDAQRAAAEVQAQGARAVVITLGAQGAVGVDEHTTAFGWHAPRVHSVSAVGSGDACFAAIVQGCDKGLSLAEATRRGVAAGAANTLRPGAGHFERGDVDHLLTAVHPIDSDPIS